MRLSWASVSITNHDECFGAWPRDGSLERVGRNGLQILLTGVSVLDPFLKAVPVENRFGSTARRLVGRQEDDPLDIGPIEQLRGQSDEAVSAFSIRS